MFDVVSFAEIDGQHLELLPARTLMQTAPNSGGSDPLTTLLSGSGGGQSDPITGLLSGQSDPITAFLGL